MTSVMRLLMTSATIHSSSTMKSKRALTYISVLLAIAFAAWFLFPDPDLGSNQDATTIDQAAKGSKKHLPQLRVQPPQAAVLKTSEATTPLYRVSLTAVEPLLTATPTSTIAFSNAGSHAVLKGTNGQVLWDAASQEKPLYSAKPSPDSRFVVLSFGGGNQSLYRLDPFQLIKQLPPIAPVERGTSFEEWSWIDGKHLVGLSAIEESEDALKGLTAAEKEANWCEKKLLYVYDIEQETLQQVQTEGIQLPSVFRVNQMLEGGHLKISADFPDGGWRSVWLRIAPR